uniref:Uncharacterized protein n=1 Tax=Meloidogyne hapla TaxID=6305 RepID=A0A1I8BSK1_MELHA
MPSSLFLSFWLTINLIFVSSAYAAPFDPYEFEIQSAPIYRRFLVNNLAIPLPSPRIVALDILNDGEEKQPRGVNVARKQLKQKAYGKF